MQIITNNFKDEAEKAELVAYCESRFERRLDRVSEFIASINDLHIIALCGPTCSGKTTTSNKIVADLNAAGCRSHVISIDDFFKERSQRELTTDKKVDYDSIDAIDFDYLAATVDLICKNKTARIPRFNFAMGLRDSYEEISVAKGEIVIFEGIQALYPQITELFGEHNSRNIYIRPSESLFIDDENDEHDRCFSPDELRLMRRIVRDNRTRGASPEFTFFIWDSVRANEEANIFPFEGNAHIRINSTLAYEVNVIKPYIMPLLDSVPADSIYRPHADAIIQKLAPLEVIDYKYVPDKSVYKEFLG